MEEWWKRAKTFAEEAAKKTQTTTKLTELISETTKKSKELTLEASKKADLLKTLALQQADQFRSVADLIPSQIAATLGNAGDSKPDFETFGVTGDLVEFVKGFTSSTFQNFPIQDEGDDSGDDNKGSNIRKDLTEWQAKHASLVLSTVKEISRLRYELCPRVMKERRFWRIYFTLVSTHIAPYEKKYVEEAKLKSEEQPKDAKAVQTPVGDSGKSATNETKAKSSASSSSAQQDLDSYLLGDFDESDGAPDDHEEGSFDDDFDKIETLDDEDDKDQQ